MTINISRSLAHGLEILLLYDFRHLAFTVAEISRKLGYSQSKTYRLVRTLIQYGFLKEDRGTSRYLI